MTKLQHGCIAVPLASSDIVSVLSLSVLCFAPSIVRDGWFHFLGVFLVFIFDICLKIMSPLGTEMIRWYDEPPWEALEVQKYNIIYKSNYRYIVYIPCMQNVPGSLSAVFNERFWVESARKCLSQTTVSSVNLDEPGCNENRRSRQQEEQGEIKNT